MTQNSFLIIKTKSTRTVFKFWVKLKYRFLKKKKIGFETFAERDDIDSQQSKIFSC